MAKSRSRKLKGRGIGPSKVTPEVAPEVEEDVIEEPYTIEEYDLSSIMEFDPNDKDQVDEVTTKLPPLKDVVENGDGPFVLSGIMEGATAIKVAKKNGTIVGVRIEGEPIDSESEITYPVVYGEGFEESQEEAVEGASRRRLKKQARRTKRNRRALKGKKLRKLTTRRR
jgi:hypothetical protein